MLSHLVFFVRYYSSFEKQKVGIPLFEEPNIIIITHFCPKVLVKIFVKILCILPSLQARIYLLQ